MVISGLIRVESQGRGDTIDIGDVVQAEVDRSGLRGGIVTLFVSGSTAGLTTIEYEPGAVADFARLFEEIAASGRDYSHHLAWGCDNGHSHVRAALLGPSLTVPIIDGKLTLGTWQQIIVIDFDTRPRQRKIVVQILGD
ncbi:MAG: YjbQ family protein [bacterium]|nr:YjbQ family protein [bacterium]